MALNDDWSFYSRLSWEDQVLDNVVMYLKDDLLKRGAYYNVNIDQTNFTGRNESILQGMPTVNNPSDYRFYAGIKPDWVWETGIQRYEPTVGSDPLTISGIDVNGTFVPTGSTYQGTGYNINYSRGGVEFDNHMDPATYTVKCPYSVRWVSVYPQDSDVYREIIPDWYITASGLSESSYQPSVFLPCIFVDIMNMRHLRGTEIGSAGRYTSHELSFDIMTTSAEERRKLQDVIFFAGNRNLQFFDADAAPKPLNINGELTSQAYNYSELITNYPLSKWAKFNERVNITKINNFILPLHRSVVKASLETDVFK